MMKYYRNDSDKHKDAGDFAYDRLFDAAIEHGEFRVREIAADYREEIRWDVAMLANMFMEEPKATHQGVHKMIRRVMYEMERGA